MSTYTHIQYGGAVGSQGWGTREIGFDPIAAGQLYTNASFEPDAEWRKEDEAFIEKIKAERYDLYGEEWCVALLCMYACLYGEASLRR